MGKVRLDLMFHSFLTEDYRSVHNCCAECTWFDWTRGVGEKWYIFFYDLETHYGLCHDNPTHIWLLHYLFLSAINRDAEEWIDVWNCHKMQLSGERNHSPRDMFMFGLLQQGPRGVEHMINRVIEDEDVHDIASYGIDWQAQLNPLLMNHLRLNNPEEYDDTNPFSTFSTPETMAEVVCDAPNCSLSPIQVKILSKQLLSLEEFYTNSMEIRKSIWTEALACCRSFFPVGT